MKKQEQHLNLFQHLLSEVIMSLIPFGQTDSSHEINTRQNLLLKQLGGTTTYMGKETVV